MTRRIGILAAVALLLGCPGMVLAQAGGESATSSAFAVASLHLEQNVTDGDGEVVFEVTGRADGLTKLNVVSPAGRSVIDFTAPTASTLGMREFRFESPEPEDIKTLTSAYPEGAYTFTGVTASGAKLRGRATLSHKLPPPVSLLRPKADAEGVVAKNLQIAWTPVANLAAYIVYIEQPDLGVSITARLPGSVAAFAVPDGFLRPGTAYQLGIGTVTDVGNVSFVETTFTTAGTP